MITYKEGCTKEVNEYYETAKKFGDINNINMNGR